MMFVFKSENRKWRTRARAQQPLTCRKINRKRFSVSFSTSWRPVFQSSSSSFLSSFVSPDESASTFATSCTKYRFAIYINSHYLPELSSSYKPAHSSGESAPHYRDRLLPPAWLRWLLSPRPGGAPRPPEEQQHGGGGGGDIRGHEAGAGGGRAPAHQEH